MKVAALISGEPRFCADFDIFLKKLKNYEFIDWYFFLWNKNYNLDPFLPKANLVGSKWIDYDYNWAYEKIQSCLPENNKIVKLEIGLKENFLPNIEFKNIAMDTKPKNCWLMYQGLKQVNKLLENSGNKYDLVMRARPDIALDTELDMIEIQKLVCSKQILVPNKEWHGWRDQINDFFAIGLQEDIGVYCSAIDSIPRFISQDKPFHPETLLSDHLIYHKIGYKKGPFHTPLRTLGSRDGIIYNSLFGRWND